MLARSFCICDAAWRGREKDANSVRVRVLRSLFCLQPLCFAAFMDKGARQHDKRGEAGQRSGSYVRAIIQSIR